MTAQEIVEEIRPLGTEGYKKVMRNHGIREPFFGVKIEELQKIRKRVKQDYQLALDLYDTGIYDAMYLAGLIADDARMTRADLQRWLEQAYCPALSEVTVAWVAAGSPHGEQLAREWIESPEEGVAAAGWATMNSRIGITADDALDLGELERLLERVARTIHQQPNRVRYAMNSFVIAVGTYVRPLTERALQTAAAIGPVTVDLSGDCKVPAAADYIRKAEQRGTLGKKRKSAKC